jgi:hypothetical protein
MTDPPDQTESALHIWSHLHIDRSHFPTTLDSTSPPTTTKHNLRSDKAKRTILWMRITSFRSAEVCVSS